MRFVPIGQEEEKPGLRFVPLSQPTEEAPALVSPEEMLTPTAGAPITPTEMAKAVGERLVGGAKYIAGTEEEKRGSLIGDIVTGVERANVGAAGIFRAIAESTAPVLDPITGKILPENPLRRIASEFERLGVESEARAKARAPKGEQDVLSAGVSSGVQSLTQTLMAIPMALLPGGQPAALTMLSTNTGGNAYQEARNKGLSPAQAIPYAVSQASIEYATEVMPLTKLVSDINQKTGFGKLLMNQIVREVPGEQIATVLQDMNDWAVLNPEKTAQQYLEERPSAAAQTLVATIVGVGGNVIVGKALQSVVGAAAPEVTEEAVLEKKEPVFVPLTEAVTPVTPEAPEVPAAPVTPPVTAVTEEEEGPMFTEELVTEREVRAAKPAEPAKATISQEEFTKLESDLAQVRAKQLDPTLSLDDPKLVEYQQQEADIRAKIDAARGVTPVTESLYDRLIKASPTELKKIDIPTSEAPDLYLRASEDENASPALVKKLTKIVNEMGPEEFAAPTVEPAVEPVTLVTPKEVVVKPEVIPTEDETPKQLSDAEKVTVAEELLDGLRFGDTIDLDNQKSVQELLGISRGFDAPVARRLMAIAKVPKAIQDKVMKQRPTTIDELSEFIAPLSKESAARAKDEKLFAQAKELAKTDEDVRQALDIYQSYKNMMEAIATERGKYGVKWAERNVSARWVEQSQKAKKAKQRVIDLMRKQPVKKPAEKKAEIKEEKAKANQLRQEVQREIAKNYERDLEIEPGAGEIIGDIKTINKFKVYKIKYGSETQYRVQSPFNRAMNRIGKDDSWHSDLGNAKAHAQGTDPLTPEQFIRDKEYYAERAAREAAAKVEEEVTPVTPEAAEGDVLLIEADEKTFEAALKPSDSEDERLVELFDTKQKPAKPQAEKILTPSEAKKIVDSWKQEVKKQGKSGKNSDKTVISLFDASGEWSKPWDEAGFNVVAFDLQSGDDIREFDATNLLEEFGNDNVWAILAAPPCTDFASSGAQYWAKKDAEGKTEESNELVRQVLRTVELLRPAVWAMENPVGRMAKLNELPPAQLTFQPNVYGDPYTKKTLLWGNFNNQLPQAPVEPTEGSKITEKISGSNKYARSLTPEGFAYAFFMANNPVNMTQEERLSREFHGISPNEFKGAGSEEDIRNAIQDDYYDGDLKSVRDTLKTLKSITEPATEAKKEEHIEDGESEPITKPVIQEAVTKGADRKDIDYTAMRREVERQVDEAIAKSPYETEKDWDATYSSRQNFVTFSIPGDGKFKIKNNKERLEEFKKKLMASVKPKAAKGPQLAIAPADVNTTLRDLVDSNDIQSAIEFAALKGVKISESKLDLKQKLKVKEYMEDPDAFERKVAAEAELTEAQRQAMAEAEEKRRIETNKRLAEEQEKREQDWVNARYQDLKTGSQRTIKEVLRVMTKDGANKILDKIDISEEVFPEEIIETLQKKAGTYVETRWKEFVNKISSPLEIARVTKKLFEKYSTKEGSIPLHKLVEKEVDGGSTIITMDSGERRLGDAAGYLSEKKIGTVGMDYAGFLLSRKPKGKKEIPLENISLAQIDRNLPGAKKRLPPGRSPELTAAAAQVKDGTMSAAEYDELVNKYKPIPVYTEAMKPATPEQVFDALDVAKRDKINPKIANGTPVGLRLDIPAFNRKGVFVVSIHKKRTPSAAGPVIGYGSVAKVTDATFGLGKETKALDIAAGASKDVLQTIEGRWNNISPEQAYKEAQEAINNPEWVQIGIDPTRHSYFYDRRTTLPIVKADEVIQIGNMLLGKGVEFGKKEDFLYNIESGPQLTERVIFEGISNARKQQLDELGRLARKKSELIKKIRNYGSDIETQRLLNELQDQIKIYRSGTAAKEPVTSAETFLKHARDAIDGTGMFREKSLNPDVFAVIQAAYIKTPWVLEGLRLSIKTPKQEGRASGIFIPMDRIVRLYRGTEGVEDPNTVRHELMHSLEQMMTGGAKDAVIQAWAKAFERAIKKYTDKKSQEYFKRVMDFLETPSAENRDKATEALPSYELYQYINPSEYWAVNAEKLYASQLGTAWDRFKKAIKKLFEGLKSVFGFNNTYAVHKLFDQIMGSAPGRMNRSSLTDYLLAGKAKIDFLENVQDDQKLIDKYKRPQTPMLNTEPVKNFVVNQARFAKAFFKDAVANPVEAIDTLFNGMSRGVHYLRNKNIFMGAGLEVADQEKYAGMLRNSQGLAIASVALDNALHSPNIATQVIFRGGIKFNKKAGVFVAAKNDTDTSMLGVYKAEAKLKEKLGAQLGTDIIQGYLEAKRSRSIKEELAVRDQELENLRNQLDSMDPADPDYENVRNQVNQAVDDLLAIKKAADKINMSDEEIAEFIDREKAHPELREIMDNFTGTNQNLLKFWYKVGLLSEGRYKALSKIKDYVPWYRIMDDEQDVHSPVQSTTRSMTNIGKEKLFKSGKPKTVVDFVAEDNQTEFRIQPSSVVKVKVNGVEVQNYTANAKGEITFSQPLAQGDVVVIETAREIENMIDNMTRNVMRMTMNGLRQYASTRIVQEYASRNEKGKIMVFPKADRNKGRFDYIANGRRVVVEIKDPLVAEAIFGMENIGLETFKAFAAVANMTRRMITMNPLFQVKQVFKDGPSAAFITGVKNPYGMVADVYTSFIKALKGDDETVDILRAAGIGGFQSPTRTPEAEIKRKIGVINKSSYDMIMAALDQFGDSSDVAQRKAIYDRVMKETGDEMRAIYQASTIMPFHRHGSGRVAQAIIKTVPFMGAYANSIDVLARALIGGNIKGMNRKKAMKYLGGAFIALSSVSLLYAFVAGLDDDYWELDDQTRLRNVILPFSKKLTGEMIMMPMNTGAAFIFKAMPELVMNYILTRGTDKKMDRARVAKAVGEAAIDSLLGPEPIPSAVKPIIEIGLNRNFFTGREMTPKGMEDLEAADQFTAATSELGKMMGSITDVLNPIEADHLVRSIFGTVGAMVQWGSNLIFAASRPEMTIKELPVTGAFVAPKYPRGKEDLFYDFLERTRKKHATFTDRLDRMDVDSAVDYMEKNAGLIVLYDYASQLEAELKEINKDIRLYSRASQDLGLTSKERREIIDGLNTIKRGKLEGIEIFRNLSEEIKVTE